MAKEEKGKSKIKLYINHFRELWANPRGRAMILLGVYGFFMLFVVGGVRTSISVDKKQTNENKVEEEVVTPSFSLMDNYEYDLKVQQNEEITLFQGKRNKEKTLFVNTLNNNTYYVEENNIYQVINGVKTPLLEPIYNVDISKFNPTFLNKLIEEATLDYTTNYSTGIVKKNYILSLPAFMKELYGKNISSNEIITITTNMKDEVMQSIEIDLLGYEKITDSSITTMKLEIAYKNIGYVEEFYVNE